MKIKVFIILNIMILTQSLQVRLDWFLEILDWIGDYSIRGKRVEMKRYPKLNPTIRSDWPLVVFMSHDSLG